MTTTTYTRFVAVSFATMLLLGAVAAPAAAGLPDPPARPNQHDAKSGVGDVYDGSVFILRTKDKTVTKTQTWKVPCGQKRTVSVTHDNEYGMSLSGPLGDTEMNGVQQAAGDLRPEKRTVTEKKAVNLPPGKKKATLKHTATYRHVHYKIYVQRQAVPAQNELIGYVHRKTLESTAWKLDNPCGGQPPVVPPNNGPPVIPPGRWPKGPQPLVGPGGGGGRQPLDQGDGPQPVDGKYPFQSPQLPVEPRGEGPGPTGRFPVDDDSAHTDEASEFTGHRTADEATVLLSERFQSADVPGVAERFIAAKRVNVEVEGGTVGMRTDDDGNPVSVRTTPYENPDVTVTVEDTALRELETAPDPVATARREIAQGRIEYSTSDPVEQAAFHAAEAGLRGASFVRGAASTVGSFARGVTTAL